MSDAPNRLEPPLPLKAQVLMAGTDWAALDHACADEPEADRTEEILVGLLASDFAVRRLAVRDLASLVLHQNTVYGSTAAASLVVAAVLADVRTEERGVFYEEERCLRAELLDWLGSVADAVAWDAGGEADLAAVRAVLPAVFDDVSGFLDDRDPAVSEASLAAAATILLDPGLAERSPLIANRVRTELAVSTRSHYRVEALRALEAWGEDVTELRERHDIAWQAERAASLDGSVLWASGWNEEAPF
ncbi:hypothetical protein ACFV1W_26475 [Kitasatospora sp. NPDC059648]|uniref:hypothetical protein n=1 Tax=Kitasatospora sp. NPDC059648 TaxID=3346894 RepID=UPI003684CF0C